MSAEHRHLDTRLNQASCPGCRHERFNPGPATTSPRRLNPYGRFRRGAAAKRLRILRKVEAAHAEALTYDASRTFLRARLGQ